MGFLKKRFVFIMCIALLLGGCGFTRVAIPNDPTFDSIKLQFYYDTGVNVDHIPIYFEDLDGFVIGTCYYSAFRNYIEIDKNYWDEFNAAEKEQIIYHELGHCALGRIGHTIGYTNWCPNSIMNTYAFSPWEIENCYIPYHNKYINELMGY